MDKAISEAALPSFQSIRDRGFSEEVFPTDDQALYAKGTVQAIADGHWAEASTRKRRLRL
ncbi:MAG: hypothetical protein RLZZ511_1893 [Cyanobacteriota bacterium]|jgi:hypothetical protein